MIVSRYRALSSQVRAWSKEKLYIFTSRESCKPLDEIKDNYHNIVLMCVNLQHYGRPKKKC